MVSHCVQNEGMNKTLPVELAPSMTHHDHHGVQRPPAAIPEEVKQANEVK